MGRLTVVAKVVEDVGVDLDGEVFGDYGVREGGRQLDAEPDGVGREGSRRVDAALEQGCDRDDLGVLLGVVVARVEFVQVHARRDEHVCLVK